MLCERITSESEIAVHQKRLRADAAVAPINTPEAIEAARRALALVSRAEERPLAEMLQRQIALYEAGSPYRE